MKSTELKRKTPLRTKTPLRRGTKSLVTRTQLRTRTPLAKANRKRKAKTYARNYGERGHYIREMPCTAQPCGEPSQAAHVIARGMGGAKGDKRKLAPLCKCHHDEAGEARTSQRAAFEAKYGVDLIALAERIAVHLDNRGIP